MKSIIVTIASLLACSIAVGTSGESTYRLASKKVAVTAPDNWSARRGFPETMPWTMQDELIFFPLPTPDTGQNGAASLMLRIYEVRDFKNIRSALKRVRASHVAEKGDQGFRSEVKTGNSALAVSSYRTMTHRVSHSGLNYIVRIEGRLLHFTASVPILSSGEAGWRETMLNDIQEAINSCNVDGQSIDRINISEDRMGVLIVSPDKAEQEDGGSRGDHYH